MARHVLVLVAVTLSLLLAGCTSYPQGPTPSVFPWPSFFPTASASASPPPEPTVSPTPSPTASPSPSAGSLASLRYAVLASVGGVVQFCDRDYYPVGSEEREMQNAEAYVANPPDRQEFDVILQHMGLSGTVVFSQEQKLAVYREYKRINAVVLDAEGGGYRFRFMAQYPNPTGPSPGAYGEDVFLVRGSVTADGQVTVSSQEPAQLVCPICLAERTEIDTPSGTVLVQDVRVGTVVWTQDGSGQRVAAPVVRIASRPAQFGQPIVHLELDDGRDVWLSAGHPLADGRFVADLKVGDNVDKSRVARLDLTHYGGAATFDLLPDGPKGTYWANGILMGSTLQPPG